MGGSPLQGSDPLGLFDLRDAAGFVPVLGSGLDAYDAFKCGNIGMGMLNTALALMDLTGGGALIKGLVVGTMKWGERELIWRAFLNTKNWDSMRKRLQRANVLPINSTGTPNRDWDTVDHIIKQDWGWPHWIQDAPPFLQTGIPKWLNSSFEGMIPFERAQYLPDWMKLAAGGAASYGAGLFVGSSSGCGCK